MKSTTVSERTRMQAALRLADVLTIREEREMTELRAAARVEAARIAAQAGQTPLAPEWEDAAGSTDVRTDARSFLARIKSRDVGDGDSIND